MNPDRQDEETGVSYYDAGFTRMMFGVPYKDIQSGDVTTVLTALQGFLQSRERVIKGRGRVVLFFEGYDDDPRNDYDIPEIRRYAQALDKAFPYWFYFADPQQITLKVLCLCLCRVVKVPGGSAPHKDDFKQFLYSHFAALNHLCDEFQLDDEINVQVTSEALAQLVPQSA